jgi:adenylylsulfate kinase
MSSPSIGTPLVPKVDSKATRKRSIVKAVTYRVVIIILDFTTIYIITGKVNVAIGFMLISNLYTTVAYYLHERIWSGIQWGRRAA